MKKISYLNRAQITEQNVVSYYHSENSFDPRVFIVLRVL
jgi:hypothetical protein